jgi:hypothetical protein
VEELFSGKYKALLEFMQEMLSRTPSSRPDAKAALEKYDIYEQYGIGWK